MTPWRRRPTLLLILVGALLVLLPLLAALQYQWLGQVSRAEHERMQGSLRAGLAQVRQDFDRELARAFIDFQMDATTLREQASAAYAERYANWVRTAPYPRLVADLFIVSLAENQSPSLARLNRESGRVESAAWPPELEGWRSRLRQANDRRRSLPSHLRMVVREVLSQPAGRGRGKIVEQRPTLGTVAQALPFIHNFIEPIAEEIPALVVPLVERPVTSPGGPPQFFEEHGYAIVKLDFNYLQREFVPMLVRRYFTTDHGLDYHFALVSRGDPGKIIYQSDAPQSAAALSESDAKVNLFGLRLDEFGSLLAESLPRARADRFAYFIRSTGGPNPGGGALLGEESERWQLLAKHRAGSLEAAVGSARRRSLLVSFGILLLLGVSVGLIFVSARRAERLARQQMEFVAGVSHELRTPLAVICSAAENLADGYIGNPQQVQRYGAVIRSEGRRLAEMVEQVLEVAGAQSGRKTYELRPSEPSQAIEEALAACHLPLSEGGFEVETRVEPGLPLVPADPRALNRAIQNLLNNAMKYSGGSRWIGLGAQAVQGEGGPEVRITVADRGPGIALADLPHIFEPFYRGREVVAAQIHGSGLGLSLVKQILEAHGGSVTVASEPGRGTAFTLHLPVASASSPEGSYEQAHSAG